MKYRLLVFDWDGTIMDSTTAIAESVQRAAADMDLPVPAMMNAKHIIGLGIVDSMKQLFPMLDEGGLRDFAQRYRAHYLPREHELLLYAGIEALLTELKHRERFLAVATGKPRRGLERAFDQCGLRHHFQYSACADEWFPKPNPHMLEKLMKFTDVAPHETLMIGDTTHDLEFAANAKCDAIGVSYGAHDAAKLATVPSRTVVHSVAELSDWIKANA